MRRTGLLGGLVAGSLIACGPAVDDGATSSSGTGSASTIEASATSATSDAPTTSGSTSEVSSSTTTTAGTTTTTTTTAGTTGPADPVCAAAAAIEIKDAIAIPAMGPAWEPGESVTIQVTLHNAGSEDFLDYPGIRVQADHPGVTTVMPEDWLFALLLAQDNSLMVTFTAAADVPAPSVVTFTIAVGVLNQECPGLMQTGLPVDLQ